MAHGDGAGLASRATPNADATAASGASPTSPPPVGTVSGLSSRSPKNARPGDTLLVIHEFQARSEDELGLTKGDRVELIERDDDFGDGWYLGKHVQSGRTGLFPEVYTIIDPKQTLLATSVVQRPALSPAAADPASNLSPPPPYQAESDPRLGSPSSDIGSKTPITPPPPNSSFNNNRVQHTEHRSSYPLNNAGGARSQSQSGYASTASLVSGAQLSEEPESIMLSSGRGVDDSAIPPANRITSTQSSTVMTETLDVINEHITNLKKPGMGVAPSRMGRRGSADSVSLYSRHMNQSVAHIKGEETDEEEGPAALTREEVSKWSPAEAAKYLERLGVEKNHCEVFREQEFSGDVLLAMDQSTIFLKELDLGPIGRRLKTWHKIKALQEEVRIPLSQLLAPPTSSSKAAALSHSAAVAAAATAAALPHIPQLRANQKRNSIGSIAERSPSHQTSFTQLSQHPHRHRPSAASIREMGHSRRHSSVENTPLSTTPNSPGRPAFHHKHGSFDQSWNMNAQQQHQQQQQQQSNRTQPTSNAQSPGYDRSHDDMGREISRDTSHTVSDYERGYSSSGEMGSDYRQRRFLRKKSPRADHNRFSSIGSERSLTRGMFLGAPRGSSHSRSASATPSLSQNEDGTVTPTERPDGARITITSGDGEATTSDGQAPAVTRLEYDNKQGTGARVSRSKTVVSPGSSPTHESSTSKGGYRKGFRTISDAITGREKAQFDSPETAGGEEKNSTSMDSSRNNNKSPDVTTGASTPSATTTKSMDEEGNMRTLTQWSNLGSSTGSHKKKSKKATSAYTRGLERKTPQEQMVGADYSGWMHKKSSNLMTTWKKRFFVLKGRRLSYYYSENDTEEKGLIDISSHRVLAANNDFLTGLHATLTGVSHSGSPNPPTPSSPSTTSHDTTLVGSIEPPPMSPTGSSFTGSPDFSAKEGSKTFIFKLLPPRSGLQKAVNFTKPTVHYFAVPSLAEGRKWMAAIMKATIDRDETVKVITTYTQKTISLAKARARQERPPFLMNVSEENGDEKRQQGGGDGGEGKEGGGGGGGDSGSITAPSSEVGSSYIEITDVEPYELPRSKEERARMAAQQQQTSATTTGASGGGGGGSHRKQESSATNASSSGGSGAAGGGKEASHGLGIQGAISGGLKTVGGFFSVNNNNTNTNTTNNNNNKDNN